jgi:hypothetical protein
VPGFHQERQPGRHRLRRSRRSGGHTDKEVDGVKLSECDDLYAGERCTAKRITFLENHRFMAGQVRYDIMYGDSGWDCDPGTYSATKEEAIADVRIAIGDLEEILAKLQREPS